MPRYFFDIKDGHSLIDPSGFDCKNDTAAIDRARTLAIGVSLDRPEVDPARHIAIRNNAGQEISTVPASVRAVASRAEGPVTNRGLAPTVNVLKRGTDLTAQVKTLLTTS
jgi:uncharacterized protein DUF6894